MSKDDGRDDDYVEGDGGKQLVRMLKTVQMVTACHDVGSVTCSLALVNLAVACAMLHFSFCGCVYGLNGRRGRCRRWGSVWTAGREDGKGDDEDDDP